MGYVVLPSFNTEGESGLQWQNFIEVYEIPVFLMLL